MLSEQLKDSYCWVNSPPIQRLTHVYFRRELSLDSIPAETEIHIFANTLYQLFVNGKMIGTGPARAYPEFPEYDSYQLQNYLKTGNNVIALNIAHHGMATFHHVFSQGGFSAAGNVGDVSLNTPGSWKCRMAKGYNANPHRFSFAIGPVQTFDARKENDDWKMAGIPSGDWEDPVSALIPASFHFSQRSIPPLTNEEQLPTKLLSANYHENNETHYSLNIFGEIDPEAPQSSKRRNFVHSFIFSEKPQCVEFGCWWGEYFLNGRRLPVDYDESVNFRQHGTMELEEGWNFFIFSVDSVQDVCELQLGIPVSADLIFSANQDKDADTKFRVTEPIDNQLAQTILDDLPGKSLNQITDLKELWQDYIPPEIPEADIRYMSWLRFGEPVNLPKNQLENIEISAGRDCTLIFDLGQISLGRVFVEYSSSEGTYIDIGYAEELLDGRPNYNKKHLVYSAERQICAEGPGRLETFSPRGLRYLQVTVSRHTSPIIIEKVGIMSQVYPYTRKGKFSCSDENFNNLYEWGWNTLRLCSEDVITDCPWRERTLYGGDLLPASATGIVMSGDLRLIKRCIEIFLQSQDDKTGWLQSMAPMRRDRVPLFDYPPLILLNAEWYCRLSGDAEFAKRSYPVFKKMLDHALSIRSKNGLFRASNLFIEPYYSTTQGVVTTFNALMSRTFAAWSSILNILGRPYEAEEALSISKEVSMLISQYLWDEDSAAFADGAVLDGLSDSHGIAANSWTELFADIDPIKWNQSLKQIKKLMAEFNPYEFQKSVSTYGAFYLLGALYKAGEAELAENCIRTIYAQHLESPTGTIWEYAHPEKSLVHAWSTAPNFYFATRILGVQLGFPEETDVTKITIAPEAETLTWAQGIVPHPLGDISISWNIEGDRLLFNYHVHEEVKVEVKPKGKLGKLELVVTSSLRKLA